MPYSFVMGTRRSGLSASLHPRLSYFKQLALRALLAVSFTLVLGLTGCQDSGSPVGTGGEKPPNETFTSADFESAEDCKSCHPQHYAEWSGSMHAYAMTDPVFFAIRTEGQSQYVGALDQNCVQCHSPIGSRAGELPWGPIDQAKIAPILNEGITCTQCHSITSYSRLGTAGMEFHPSDTLNGGIEDPVANTFHESVFNSLFKTGEFCGSCHDFVTETGLELERTYREWNEAGHAVTGKTCADCHMPAYTGIAAPGAPERTLHRHTFVGADVALIDFPNKSEQADLVRNLLQNAITLELNAPPTVRPGTALKFSVALTNDKTGHNVPSGTSFRREMWLSIIVKDDFGNVVYSSGQLDENDDLIEDDDLFNAQSTMKRADGSPTPATWEAADIDNPSLSPGETRDMEYSMYVQSRYSGALSVKVALRFRSFSPSSLRELGLNELLPIPLIDMATASATVQVQSNRTGKDRAQQLGT